MQRNSCAIVNIEHSYLLPEDSEIILHPATAGIILFSRNFVDTQQLTDLITQIKDMREDILIAVDQEGGRVQRFSVGFTPLPALSSIDNAQDAYYLGLLMAYELLECKLDFSFAPVLDIEHNRSQVMNSRTFLGNAAQVQGLAVAYIKGMSAAGMKNCGKHFPGHGFADADSHKQIAVDNRSCEKICEDLLPYQQQLDSVMLSHVLYPQVDDAIASMSAVWIEMLRERFAFTGIVMSDDLSMQAVASYGDIAERTRRAVRAGCDVIIMCNQQQGIRQCLEELQKGRNLRQLMPTRKQVDAGELGKARNIAAKYQ